MKIEAKLAFSIIRKNIKRTIFTIISIILCTIIIFSTMLLISSIKNGIAENIETAYNDYHFIIRNINIDSFNKIRNKEYIDKIYIQEEDNEQLKELKKTDIFFSKKNNFNVFIKYKNIKKVCNYTTDIIQTLGLNNYEVDNKCEFNQKLLVIYGLIDVEIVETNDTLVCRARVNYSYVLDIMIIVILVVFSILFIIILYNAFLISINERKREYAILNSVGGTEGQILKMIFIEGIIIGTIGIIIGGLISYIVANIILNILNNILINTPYNFRLIFNIKYIILSLFIIMSNIYISAIIPSVKASTTSVIQEIRNNKQIKYKNKNTILEKFLPIEGKIAIKNIKRNKNKYKIINILLVLCMVSYIVVSTYINYEKRTSEIISEYDVDAKLNFKSEANIDYKSILNNYEIKYGNKIEYIEYKIIGGYVLVEPTSSIITNNLVTTYENNKKSIQMVIIGLDDTTYKNYIKKLNANNGDFIIYNNTTEINGKENLTYRYYPALKKENNLKLSIISNYYNYEKNINEYEIIDNEKLNGNFILTDELIEGFKEIKTEYKAPTIFVDMDVYNKINEKINNYISKNKNNIAKWIYSDTDMTIKIKCKNIIEFSNYIEDINKKQNIEIDAEYYTLKNQEKIIYINIVQLILDIIIIAIITIGSVSTINIINASLCEREQDFNILYCLGATKKHINKILIYECIYMFIKATIISSILSIPILYGIIKYMENIIILNELLIPFGNICIFFTIILIISLIITICSTMSLKYKKYIGNTKKYYVNEI